jgi:hypothetical protein
MLKWYQKAGLCYAYLSDVEGVLAEGSRSRSYPSFRDSLWFTRGWILQELLGSREVLFLDRNWDEIGTRSDLAYQYFNGHPSHSILIA